LHYTCIKYVVNREVCPICRIYVSEYRRRGVRNAGPAISSVLSGRPEAQN
jgi:hypothetical protein